MNPRQTFVEVSGSGRIRLTRSGIERYRSRFARIGVDVARITTRAELEAAVDASFTHELYELVCETNRVNPELNHILAGLLTPRRYE